jgi:hypothetical protein
MEPEFSRVLEKKQPNIKFHEDLSSGSRLVPSGRLMEVRMDNRYGEAKVAFPKSANAPTNENDNDNASK